MPTAKKATEIDVIEQKLRDAPVAILTDYRGLTVAQTRQLRGLLRPSEAEFRVVKNTLTRIAAGRVGIDGLDPLLEGPTAIVFTGDDISAPARVLQDVARTMPVLRVKGMLLEGRVADAAQVTALASLPSKGQLQAQLVASIQGPLAAVVGTLQGAISGLVYTLEARSAQMNEAA